jgi:hypothetical protein
MTNSTDRVEIITSARQFAQNLLDRDLGRSAPARMISAMRA